ncbi:hypothetical protein ABMC88_00795 [Sulfitobacter sp. HNIBRBA2951]|uniref:calcium-binding protein n=1 Tax=Sulfitobacter aquimarinus TaxID=3158557 RepID=UPI0032DF9B63
MTYMLLLALAGLLVPAFTSDEGEDNQAAPDPQEPLPEQEDEPVAVVDPDPVTPDPVTSFPVKTSDPATLFPAGQDPEPFTPAPAAADPDIDFGAADTLAATSGDDFIRVSLSGSQSADGGEGNDTLTHRLFGDEVEPEDLFENTGPVTLEGGAGDDYFELSGFGAQDATISGGDGDDHIRLFENGYGADHESGERAITLGAGEDVVAFGIDGFDDATPAVIEDFDAEEDVLVFELPGYLWLTSALDDAGDVSLELIQQPVAGTNDTAVTLSLSNLQETGDATEIGQTVILRNSGPLPDDAIKIGRYQGAGEEYDEDSYEIILTGSPEGTINVETDTFVITGAGDDNVSVDNSGSTYVNEGTVVYTGAGDDTITGSEENRAAIHAGEGDDVITYHGESSNLWGDSGDDEITIRGSLMQVFGGEGDDLLTDRGDNRIDGGDGNDTLIGTGESHLDGGDGDDLITVLPEVDWETVVDGLIYGNAEGGMGDDTVSIHLGQFAQLGPWRGAEDADPIENDVARVTILPEHLDRSAAVVRGFSATDTLEVTAPQSVLDSLEMQTEFNANGTHLLYHFVSGGQTLITVALEDGSGITGPAPTLDSPQFSFAAA